MQKVNEQRSVNKGQLSVKWSVVSEQRSVVSEQWSSGILPLSNLHFTLSFCLLLSAYCLLFCFAPIFCYAADTFIVAEVKQGDDFSTLATRYLGDPAKGWMISEFNDIKTLAPGTSVVIPLKPFARGGLTPSGYQTVPVLLYHRFSRSRSENMTISVSNFQKQMRFLKENGYHVISINQFIDFMDFKTQIPEKSVVLSFDDGWQSFDDLAFPILKKFNFPATLFIYTDFIGAQKALSWKRLKELANEGLDIQCHTRTHRNLTKLKGKENFKQYFSSLEDEITGSKELIRQELNINCRYLAYPYGKTNPLVVEMLKRNGYRAAFTVMRGGNPFFIGNYEIGRSVIYGEHDMAAFKKNLDIFTKTNLK